VLKEPAQRTRCIGGNDTEEIELTIGLPVFNGSKSLSAAINSLLAQTYRQFTLHISDNASTDNTRQICEDAVARDKRVVYTRQPHNLGIFANFSFVLTNAQTRFFMWAADDDRWDVEFVEKNLAALKADPRAVASISRVVLECTRGQQWMSNSTCPLRGTVAENLRRYWLDPADNSRFYAIYRTETLRRAVADVRWFHATDWAIVTRVLQEGHYLEVPAVLMWRAEGESDRNLRRVSRDNPFFLSQLFPLLPLSADLFRHLKWRLFGTIFGRLWRLNIIYHQLYLAYRYPYLYKIERRLSRLCRFLFSGRLH
jgi:glycosyltransferase involved in cell wall biosynthesis